MALKFYGGTSGGAYTPPDQTGKSGQVLTTNGSTTNWSIDRGWNLIQTIQSSATNAFAFTDIPQIYRDLRLTCSWKNNTGTAYPYFRYNGVTEQYRDVSWSTDSPTGNTYRDNRDAWWLYTYPNVFRGTYDIVFPNYRSTIYTKSFYGMSNTGEYNKVNIHGGNSYNSTNTFTPITSIAGYANNFDNGNYTWNLYGSL
jgi:hypothetical protein